MKLNYIYLYIRKLRYGKFVKFPVALRGYHDNEGVYVGLYQNTIKVYNA